MIRRAALLGVVAGIALLAMGASGPDRPERLGAHWANPTGAQTKAWIADGLKWSGGNAARERILSRLARSGGEPAAAGQVKARFLGKAESVSRTTGFTAGSTFIETPVSREHGIDRLTRNWTRTELGRDLFRNPGATASFYTVHYMAGPPYVSSRYIQFVVDPAWNRVVFGDMAGWIKALDGLSKPTSIAVDPSGRVFICEEGGQRVSVYRIEGENAETRLQPLFAITGLRAPAGIALSDVGTPLNTADDLLYVVDAGTGSLQRYALGDMSASLTGTYTGFTNPTTVATGKWDGAGNGFLYVVDKTGRRIRLFEDTGTSLDPVAAYESDYRSFFSGLTVDHFGNVYAADNTGGRVVKFTSSLEELDEDRADEAYAALSGVDVPFGRITVDGKGTYWAGFDQLFAIERWSEKSGALRRTLGLRLKDIAFSTDDMAGSISTGFLLTDFGTVGSRVTAADGNLVRSVPPAAMTPGYRELVWDRKDEGGKLLPSGDYTYEITAANGYDGTVTRATVQLHLPAYFNEVAGTDQPHLVRGETVRWENGVAVQDGEGVQYRFSGLAPASSYTVAAVYAAPPDGVSRAQDMTAGEGVLIHAALPVTSSPRTVDFIQVPAAAFASGELLITVNKRGDGSAVVSQLILKETGTGFTAKPVSEGLPTAFAITQNYPNPFNPSTVVGFQVPVAGSVTLTVYDILGREVETLVNDVKQPGTYSVRWDGTKAASGVYFCRMQTDAYSRTIKMVLLK